MWSKKLPRGISHQSCNNISVVTWMRQLSHNEFENFPYAYFIKFCYCFYYDKHFVVKFFVPFGYWIFLKKWIFRKAEIKTRMKLAFDFYKFFAIPSMWDDCSKWTHIRFWRKCTKKLTFVTIVLLKNSIFLASFSVNHLFKTFVSKVYDSCLFTR